MLAHPSKAVIAKNISSTPILKFPLESGALLKGNILNDSKSSFSRRDINKSNFEEIWGYMYMYN